VTHKSDPIDQAIAAAEAAADYERVLAQKRAEAKANIDELEPININIASTGGKAVFALHPEMTELELFEVIGFLAHAVRLELGRRAQVRAAGPKIEIARVMPPRRPS